jgi:hypothetical protein
LSVRGHRWCRATGAGDLRPRLSTTQREQGDQPLLAPANSTAPDGARRSQQPNSRSSMFRCSVGTTGCRSARHPRPPHGTFLTLP